MTWGLLWFCVALIWFCIGIWNFLTKTSTLLGTVLLIVLCLYMGANHMENDVKYLCEQNSISYDLVETTAELTGENISDVYTVFKYAAAAEMDLYDAVMLIDPDLTENEAAAIVSISDMKQK